MSAQSFIFLMWCIANHHDHTTHLPRHDMKRCQTPMPHPHSPQHTGHLGSPRVAQLHTDTPALRLLYDLGHPDQAPHRCDEMAHLRCSLAIMESVMVRPLVLHVLPKPSLHVWWLDPFLTLSDWPPTQLGHWPASRSLSRTLICFYYLSLLDPLDPPHLHFNPQPLSLTSVLST